MLILVAFIVLMYFLLVRPQKKKEKTVKAMRDALRVGDEVITIGGICGKIVKTKEDTLVIQVGADKLKFEVMRWSISSVVSKSNRPSEKPADKEEFDDEEASAEAPRKSAPRRLKKAAAEPADEDKESAEKSK
jgi:preprotein translocase YajC subunit